MRDVVVLERRAGTALDGRTTVGGLTPWGDDGRRATTPVVDLPHP
jgi:hypothetical protein